MCNFFLFSCSNGNKCVYLFMLQTPNFMVRTMIFPVIAHYSHCSLLSTICDCKFLFLFSILLVIFNIKKRCVGHTAYRVWVFQRIPRSCRPLSIIKHSENVVVVCRMEVSLFSLQLLNFANENNRQIGSMYHTLLWQNHHHVCTLYTHSMC